MSPRALLLPTAMVLLASLTACTSPANRAAEYRRTAYARADASLATNVRFAEATNNPARIERALEQDRRTRAAIRDAAAAMERGEPLTEEHMQAFLAADEEPRTDAEPGASAP